jgi:hypothetical protein
MEGKTHGKDIMLLCKGWYDRNKYKTLKDALIAYYNKNYRYSDDYEETLTYSFINKVLLKQAVHELLTERFTYLFVNYLFDTDAFSIWKYEGMKIKELEYEEELYYRITGFINNLKGIDADGIVNINTSDYWLRDDDGNEIRKDSHRVLAEQII